MQHWCNLHKWSACRTRKTGMRWSGLWNWLQWRWRDNNMLRPSNLRPWERLWHRWVMWEFINSTFWVFWNQMKNAYFHIKNLCAMEVIAVICVVGPMVVHVGHPSHRRQRQFPRVLNLEHLEDGAEVSIRQLLWSNYLSLLFQRVFWEANCLGCCKWQVMWWTWWEVLVNRDVPKSILWINWSPAHLASSPPWKEWMTPRQSPARIISTTASLLCFSST